MRFVLLQGIPRDAAVRLRDQGHDFVHVGKAGMQNAADDDILAWSAKEAVVVTLDADFHAILAVSGASGPSVKVIAEFRADLQRGCLITVKPHKTTCHQLPIGGD
jgi:predicted nuclease of predicted toxin-antitoxin system